MDTMSTKGPGQAASTNHTAARVSLPETLPPRPESPGERPSIPGYEILQELGRGGMGVVYKARHLQLDRIVALKMILTGGHAGDEERKVLQNEARTIARLQHPNIVQVYEIGCHEGRAYLAMEFVSGRNLAQRLAGDRSLPSMPLGC